MRSESTVPRHVVGLSGGKDSTAMALRLIETEPRDYEFICNETGDELPAVREHWKLLETMLGKPLVKVTYPGGLNALIEQQKMLPNFRARWCTRILKIEPTIEYFASLPKGSVLYVGLRADEELREGLYGEDITNDFPLAPLGLGVEGSSRLQRGTPRLHPPPARTVPGATASASESGAICGETTPLCTKKPPHRSASSVTRFGRTAATRGMRRSTSWRWSSRRGGSCARGQPTHAGYAAYEQ